MCRWRAGPLWSEAHLLDSDSWTAALLSCSWLSASVHFMLCNDISQHGWTVIYTERLKPNFQNWKRIPWIHWTTSFKTANGFRGDSTAHFISNTSGIVSLVIVVTYRPANVWLVLKVNSQYSRDDTSMNIWTVSGLAVCRQLCLHLYTVKISLWVPGSRSHCERWQLHPGCAVFLVYTPPRSSLTLSIYYSSHTPSLCKHRQWRKDGEEVDGGGRREAVNAQ